jgi:hypothetical protein
MFRCSNKNCRIPVKVQGYCAPCKAEYRKQWIAVHPGYATQKRKEWALKNPEKAAEIERRKYEKRKAKQPPKEPKEKLTAYEKQRRHFEKNPIRAAAIKIYKYAIRRGQLVRGPCAVCGTTENIDGHHTDYTKPLEVIWLCKPHHREAHRKLRCEGVDISDTKRHM